MIFALCPHCKHGVRFADYALEQPGEFREFNCPNCKKRFALELVNGGQVYKDLPF